MVRCVKRTSQATSSNGHLPDGSLRGRPPTQNSSHPLLAGPRAASCQIPELSQVLSPSPLPQTVFTGPQCPARAAPGLFLGALEGACVSPPPLLSAVLSVTHGPRRAWGAGGPACRSDTGSPFGVSVREVCAEPAPVSSSSHFSFGAHPRGSLRPNFLGQNSPTAWPPFALPLSVDGSAASGAFPSPCPAIPPTSAAIRVTACHRHPSGLPPWP